MVPTEYGQKCPMLNAVPSYMTSQEYHGEHNSELIN